MFTNGHLSPEEQNACYVTDTAANDYKLVVDLHQPIWVSEIRISTVEGKSINDLTIFTVYL